MSITETTQKTHNTLFREGSPLRMLSIRAVAKAAGVPLQQVRDWYLGHPMSPEMRSWFEQFLSKYQARRLSHGALRGFAKKHRPPGIYMTEAIIDGQEGVYVHKVFIYFGGFNLCDGGKKTREVFVVTPCKDSDQQIKWEIERRPGFAVNPCTDFDAGNLNIRAKSCHKAPAGPK